MMMMMMTMIMMLATPLSSLLHLVLFVACLCFGFWCTRSRCADDDLLLPVHFVFISERCVVSFTPVGTALSPGYSEEKYTAFASRSCCSPCVAVDSDDANFGLHIVLDAECC
jgi:hypothetical protein